MATSARMTAARPDELDIVIVIDDTDPELEAYRATFTDGRTRMLELKGRHRYTDALNHYAFTDEGRGQDILGAFGDDVLFRTEGWDDVVRRTLATPGFAYGDDLVHGKNHPTAVFVSREIVDALGWLALPATKHQWADDGWKRLGLETGTLRFMEGVVFEHMHPAVHKAEWDATYEGVFDSDQGKADHAGFQRWATSGGFASDVEKVRALG
jgi:hypothetical protein